jgi:hypothetical protein
VPLRIIATDCGQIVNQVVDAADLELPHRGKESVCELFKEIQPLQQAHYTLLQRISKRLKTWTTQPWLGDLFMTALVCGRMLLAQCLLSTTL